MSADDVSSGVACSRCPGFLIFKPTSFGSTVANFSVDSLILELDAPFLGNSEPFQIAQ